MNNIFNLQGYRVIDLSKHIDPATETRVCNVDRFIAEGLIPDYHSTVTINSHLGTHLEAPYHHNNDWSDVLSIPLVSCLGRAVYLEFTDMEPNTYIKSRDLERLSAGRIREGDIVTLDSSYKLDPFTPKTNTPEDKRLFINGETAKWLLDKKVKCVGFGDGVSIENSPEDIIAFHDILMEHDVVFLEVLKNLELLNDDIFFMIYAPLPIKTMDSSPVRAIAIEGIPGFTK